MKIKKIFIFLFVFLATIFTFTAGYCFMVDILKNDFEKKWEELSKNVKKLNEYTASRPVQLRNKKVEGVDLGGVVFTEAVFEEVEWIDVDASKATLTNVLFKNCKFIGGKWNEGRFIDVVFEYCEFVDTTLGRSVMNNVFFRNCKIIRTGIGYLTGGKVEFDGCHWDTGVGGDSSVEFVLRNSKIEGVSFSTMKGSMPILIENSILEEVDFSRGHLSDIVIKKSKHSDGGARFNNITAKSITFEDVDMTKGMAISNSEVGMVRVSGGRFGVAFAGSTIPKIYIRDADLFYLDFAEAKLDYVEIANCNLYDTGMWDGYIDQFLVKNSKFTIIDGENFKADIAVWENVTLDGEINLTNAHIKDFRPSRLNRGPNLNLITTGSNLRLDFSPE